MIMLDFIIMIVFGIVFLILTCIGIDKDWIVAAAIFGIFAFTGIVGGCVIGCDYLKDPVAYEQYKRLASRTVNCKIEKYVPHIVM